MTETQQELERLRTLQEQLDSALHDTAQESTLLAESAAIKQAIAEAKPEIDLNGVAEESTLQKVKESVENNGMAIAKIVDDIFARISINATFDGFVSQEPIISVLDAFAKEENITEIMDSQIVIWGKRDFFQNRFPNLKIIKLNGLERVTNDAPFAYINAKEFFAEKLVSSSTVWKFTFNQAKNLEKIYIPKAIFSDGGYAFNEMTRLIELKTGENITTNCSFVSWKPIEALLENSTSLLSNQDIANGFTSNRKKLLYNIREHIAKLLPSNTSSTSKNITFSPELKAAILEDADTADAFSNKYWNVI